MLNEGQIVLFPFPQTNQRAGKLRPALVLRQCPTQYDDWLICMISSQVNQRVDDIDELISATDADFNSTGLKKTSIIRLTRMAVVDRDILVGILGAVSSTRLIRLRQKLASWILGVSQL
ncbi:type II toxin-antitoxin system PemK/MazF family toxin [Oscillatoria sp. CS-180]|uniref:type II toxin-antitoxin system PemK/MazF family toxin n=1 Tax=Oscillatoria sp. CS-180 TaxID=3021720 RepID=UPI00232F1813|nr:type II toxin-antitoxin system PemK/MazF family toxin [Oscillatoria sp. CS-180]MDB9526143.1 type II toxin-antitoxin system PemK/MazF family toxin [Oscillatoria sp. CS-180]